MKFHSTILKDQLAFNFLAMIFVIGLALCLTSCAPVDKSTPEQIPITVQLSWTHSAQFVGLYAADINGDYATEGLAVTFVEGGPTVDRLEAVLNNTAQFGLASGLELIEARAGKKPLRAIATIFQRSPFAFFSLAASGIERPEDFVGKTIQIRPRARPILLAMMTQVGIDPGQYQEDNEADFEALYSGQVDVATGFVTTQFLQAGQAGFELKVIFPDDYGAHFNTDNIFTTDEFIAAHPDVIERFLRASFRGWTYAVENPTEADRFVSHYNPEADPAVVEAEMVTNLPFINTGQDHIGWMKPEVWAGMEKTLRDQTALTVPVDVETVYTLQFLQKIYRPENAAR